LVRHIVFFKLNNPSDKEAIKQKLLTLKDKVDVVENLEVGLNFSEEARAYDVSLIVDLKDKDSLTIYANDEYHQEVIKYIKTKANDTKVVDYAY